MNLKIKKRQRNKKKGVKNMEENKGPNGHQRSTLPTSESEPAWGGEVRK